MIIWLASYPKSGNTWLRFYIISLLMGKKVDLNLNHLKAIISYPDKTHFKGLLKDVLNIDEIAQNWIVSQNRINSDKTFKFFKTHNMFIKYKILGLITNVTLVTNLIILLGILTLFEATLTLPGIAGIILTVGMAVDANVLIFERIKEELKKENNNIIAFDSGYTKSRTAILDANVTTLLAAIILFFMGSGPIKGFSITLGVGIFTTLFSVYFIARLFTAIYVYRNKDKGALI